MELLKMPLLSLTSCIILGVSCAETSEPTIAAKCGKLLPDSVRWVESQWTNGVAAYFGAMRDLADSFARSPDIESRDLIAAAVSCMMSKKCPTNDTNQALEYFELKEATLAHFIGAGDIQQQRAIWLETAYFLQEVRAHRTPEVSSRVWPRPGVAVLEKAGVRSPDVLTNEFYKSEYKREMQAHEDRMAFARLQGRLHIIDGSLMWKLYHHCERWRHDASLTNFVQQFSATAGLTEVEKYRLLSVKKP